MKMKSFVASIFVLVAGVTGLAQSAWCVPVSEYVTSDEGQVERSTASVSEVDHDKISGNEQCQAAQSPSNSGTGYRAGNFK